jgi:GT2 family glycosyltransferase
MNPVLILTRNNLDLTRRCVESVRNQDIHVDIFAVDNGSTDGTTTWMQQQEDINLCSLDHNAGVSFGWNDGIGRIFGTDSLFGRYETRAYDHVIVIGNDTVLAPWTYSALLSANVPFVTGVDVGMSPLPDKPDVFPLSPHPDFSCFLIRRECWQKVGPFDERMKLYASDCDFHVRAHRNGIPLWKASVPYNHERSSTLNRATQQERAAIQEQANRDREVFRSIYGCLPGTKQYEELFK